MYAEQDNIKYYNEKQYFTDSSNTHSIIEN